MTDSAALLPGTLDLLILKVSSRQAARLRRPAPHRADHRRNAPRAAALYPALYRLEQQALIGEWGTSDNNRRAKFYRLTAAGARDWATKPRAGTGSPPRWGWRSRPRAARSEQPS